MFRLFRVQSIDRNSLTRPSGQRSKFEVSDTPGAGANRHTVNASFAEGSYSLSDLKEADMRCLAENQASDNMQSFASDIQGVDLPVFDDSHNNEPNSPNDITLGEWNCFIAHTGVDRQLSALDV